MSAHACCEAGGFRVKAGVRCLVIFCSFVFDGFPRCKLMPSFFFFLLLFFAHSFPSLLCTHLLSTIEGSGVSFATC